MSGPSVSKKRKADHTKESYDHASLAVAELSHELDRIVTAARGSPSALDAVAVWAKSLRSVVRRVTHAPAPAPASATAAAALPPSTASVVPPPPPPSASSSPSTHPPHPKRQKTQPLSPGWEAAFPSPSPPPPTTVDSGAATDVEENVPSDDDEKHGALARSPSNITQLFIALHEQLTRSQSTRPAATAVVQFGQQPPTIISPTPPTPTTPVTQQTKPVPASVSSSSS